jgi:hypothetical protein
MEVWKDIPGYEGLYLASTTGKIYSVRSKKCLAISPNTTYARVVLSKFGISKCYAVHRLVSMTFIPNPNNLPQVHHIDHNHHNNRVDNLAWITKEDNQTEYFHSDLFKEVVEYQRRKAREQRKTETNHSGVATTVWDGKERIC